MIGVEKDPGKRLYVKRALGKGKAESRIIPVEIISMPVESAPVIRIMIAVMSPYENEIFHRKIPQGEMPVKFGPFSAIIVGNKLDEKRSVLSKKSQIAESKVPPVFRP